MGISIHVLNVLSIQTSQNLVFVQYWSENLSKGGSGGCDSRLCSYTRVLYIVLRFEKVRIQNPKTVPLSQHGRKMGFCLAINKTTMTYKLYLLF